MLSELMDDLGKVLLAGVGAAAITAEKSGEIIKELIKKGELTIEQGKALNEELRQKAEEAARECKTARHNAELEQLSKEERDALRQKLDELEQRDAQSPEETVGNGKDDEQK